MYLKIRISAPLKFRLMQLIFRAYLYCFPGVYVSEIQVNATYFQVLFTLSFRVLRY